MNERPISIAQVHEVDDLEQMVVEQERARAAAHDDAVDAAKMQQLSTRLSAARKALAAVKSGGDHGLSLVVRCGMCCATPGVCSCADCKRVHRRMPPAFAP